MNQRSGIVKITLVVAGLLISVAIGALFFLGDLEGSASPANMSLAVDVVRGDFVSSVVEAGDIESSSNVEIRCEVKAKGKAGTAILEVVPEGTVVKEGDFICQLDDSVMRDELTQQKISVAEDKAMVIQARSSLDTAQRILSEYENGTYMQELNTLKAEVAAAKEAYRRAAEFRRHSELLNRKGFRTKTQLEADEFAEQKALLDLQLAEQNEEVYVQHTRERMVAEYKAEIERQKANVEASEYTLTLSESREKEMAQQVANCRVVAPVDGMVVYANDIDRRGDASFVIEEGAVLRDGQPIVRLPDPTKMQVRTKVNDSKINEVEVGQKCLIRVDTDPENPVQGRVSKVSSFPLPRRWYQAPIEYEVFVEVVEASELIRSGLRAKVEIFVDFQADKIQAPLSSLAKKDEKYYVFVKSGPKVFARHVEIGNNNEKFVIIEQGLEPGEQVVVDADTFLEDVDFKDVPTQP